MTDVCTLVGVRRLTGTEKISALLSVNGVRSTSSITDRLASTSALSSSLSSEPIMTEHLSLMSKGDRVSHRLSSRSTTTLFLLLFGEPKSSEIRLLPRMTSGRTFSFSSLFFFPKGEPEPEVVRNRGIVRDGEEGDWRRLPTGRGIPDRLGRIAETFEAFFGGVLRLQGEGGSGIRAIFRRRGVLVRGTESFLSSSSSEQRSIISRSGADWT